MSYGRSKPFDNFGLVYSEISQSQLPTISAFYPAFAGPELKRIALHSMPQAGVKTDSGIFNAYQLDQNHLAISHVKRFPVEKTISGSSVACLTWLTRLIFNPLILRPFLQELLPKLTRIKVNNNILKAIIEQTAKNSGKLNLSIKHGNVTIQLTATLLEESELPEAYGNLGLNP